MNRHPLSQLLIVVLALLCIAAFAGPEPGRPDAPPPNLAVDVDAPGAIRAELQVFVPDLKEPLRYEIDVQDGSLTGGIFIPPGKERLITVTAYDEHKDPIYKGETVANIDERLTPEIAIRLEGEWSQHPLEAKLGTYRLELGFGVNEGDGFMLKATVLDALGTHVPFKPDDLQWNLPEGFELLPYSCFLNSLCIELPDPKVHADRIACYRDITCWNKPWKETRGPYRYVAVGRNHTCALTITDEIRCWGDNFAGQLGAATGGCISSLLCTKVPVPVTCPTGEICKFRSVAAGGDHTCAVDTAGKAWCWGEDGSLATGVSSFGSAPAHTHRQVPAFNDQGVRADFVSIDTNIAHTCAVSAARDIFCWGANTRSQLGFPQSQGNGTPSATLVRSGNQYKSVTVGSLHSCAIHATGGLVDCWGDNFDFQLTGNANKSIFITINSQVPLLSKKAAYLTATGDANTCAQNSDDDTVCWGSPVMSAPTSAATSGFVALRASYATSLATELDECPNSAPLCTRTCVTALGGDLFCGRWMSGVPPQLAVVPEPKSNHYVVYNQVDVGPNHVCAVTSQRDVWCFGRNLFGQFGTGTNSSVRVDEPVTPTQR